MKKSLFTTLFLLAGLIAAACPVCDKQQPKILQGITHGAGPDGPADYVIVWITVVIVLVTLFYSLRFLIRPGEKSPAHIKQFIFNAE